MAENSQGTVAGSFRKKPIVIDAAQWFKNGDHPQDAAAEMFDYPNGQRPHAIREGAVVRYFRRPDVPGDKVCEHCGKTMHVHGWIDTLEGGHIVCPGDWIITGVKGERYPCKPDIFETTYEPVDSTRLPPFSLEEMVNRFLAWRLPADFGPDAGITFKPYRADMTPDSPLWPVGTNLLTAVQARAMLEHVLRQGADSPTGRAMSVGECCGDRDAEGVCAFPFCRKGAGRTAPAEEDSRMTWEQFVAIHPMFTVAELTAAEKAWNACRGKRGTATTPEIARDPYWEARGAYAEEDHSETPWTCSSCGKGFVWVNKIPDPRCSCGGEIKGGK